MTSHLWILKTGTTVPAIAARRGDFEDWLAAGLGLLRNEIRVARLQEGDSLPEAADWSAVVITGSSAMVTERAPWSVAAEEWLRAAVPAEKPLLGICYGHQLLAAALGGAVGWNPRGREIGTISVSLTAAAAADPLFAGLAAPLRMQASHSQAVLELPPGAVRLAHNETDENQAFAAGPRAWGVQFHPEFDAQIVRGYLQERATALREEGLDPVALAAGTADTDQGARLLRNFAALLG